MTVKHVLLFLSLILSAFSWWLALNIAGSFANLFVPPRDDTVATILYVLIWTVLIAPVIVLVFIIVRQVRRRRDPNG